MARPMVLIQKATLEELWYKYAQGVPIQKLIAQYSLDITPPTLTKLLMYLSAANEAKNDHIGEIISLSIFPDWLNDLNTIICKQPSNWKYVGNMPLGHWEEIR